MHAYRTFQAVLALTLALAAAPATVQAAGHGIDAELDEARAEVKAELAAARHELETGNLRVDDSLHFGDDDRRQALPRAEITPQGDFLVEDEAVAVDAGQRALLLAYREQLVGIGLAGIDIGERSAEAAIDAVDGSWARLLVGAMTGSLERRIERTVRREIEPSVLAICHGLPAVMASQRQLAARLPEFEPYATLDADDVEDCEHHVRDEFASR